MDKQTGTFNAIGDSDKRMFGETALLVCGYSSEEQKALLQLLAAASLQNLPVVFVDEELKDRTLAALAAAPENSAAGKASPLSRAIIMSGLSETELHSVMKAYRTANLPRQIWASVTPISAEWTIRYLLEELGKEKDDLRKAMAAKRAREAKEDSAP